MFAYNPVAIVFSFFCFLIVVLIIAHNKKVDTVSEISAAPMYFSQAVISKIASDYPVTHWRNL